ncbi:hypothetical protein [Rahnella selenatireducens]|uniref:hypothetical protein n=1 Tax=Rahnella selenatireducens TaxID=3389797 RepID=UPI003968555F
MAERANQAICTGAVQAAMGIIRGVVKTPKISGYTVNKLALKSEEKPAFWPKSARQCVLALILLHTHYL